MVMVKYKTDRMKRNGFVIEFLDIFWKKLDIGK